MVKQSNSKDAATFPKPEVAGFFLVLVLSLGLRIYYFLQTSDQTVWWDEANYLVKAKSLALGTPSTGYDAGRPILFSIVLAPFFWLGIGEVAIRVALALCSLASVLLTYRLGTRLFSPWAGAVAALIFSSHYLNLFYTQRIMVEIPYVTLALLGIELFLSGRPKQIWAAGPVFGLSVLMRYPAFVIPICVLVYVLLTDRKKALLKRDYYISAGLALLVVASDLLFRGAKTLGAVSGLMADSSLSQRMLDLLNCFKLFLTLFPPLLALSLVLAVLSALWILARFKSQPSDQVRAHLLLLLLFLGPILVQGLCFNHLEDRYLYASLPPVCLLLGSLIWRGVRRCPESFSGLVGTLAALFTVFICGVQVSNSSKAIEQKLSSYKELRSAGLWLKQQPGHGRVLSLSVAQLTYYSERPGVVISKSPEDFALQIAEPQNEFTVISAFEQHPEWLVNLNLPTNGLGAVFAEPMPSPVVLVVSRKKANP